MKMDFNDENLLALAFTHRSANKISNERLEFLGDSILSFIISKYLYENFPKKNEGQLTMLRSLLVKKKTLARTAKKQGFGSKLLLSRSENEAGGRNNENILADSFESFLAALYLDQGLEIAENFVRDNIISLIPTIDKINDLKDYKSLLQEKIQAKGHKSPVYKMIKEEGPDHAKTFFVEVEDEGIEIARGEGHTKQEAETEAAKNALSVL